MLINYPQAHQQLSAHAIHHFSETEFNKNIECLVQNSMAIAHTSKDHYRSEIMRLCTEVWCVCVPGTGVWIGEAASVSGVGVRLVHKI